MTSEAPEPAGQDERRQRVRIGLTGLGFVFLLVILGTAISRWSEDPAAPQVENVAPPTEPNDPLAEIGAAPGAPKPDEGDENGLAAQPTPEN